MQYVLYVLIACAAIVLLYFAWLISFWVAFAYLIKHCPPKSDDRQLGESDERYPSSWDEPPE